MYLQDKKYFKHLGDTLSNSRTIDVHVRKIRERLKIDNIKTIKGVGYKFEI